MYFDFKRVINYGLITTCVVCAKARWHTGPF